MKVYTSDACVVTILCIFATFIAQGFCHHDGGNHNRGIKGEMEGNRHLSYNIAESSCNEGNMTGGSTTVVRCCGNNVYNPLNEICCESHVHARSSVHTDCCKKEVYITTTYICCAGKIQHRGTECQRNGVAQSSQPATSTRTPAKNLDLKCGSEDFDPHTKICCSGKAYKNHDLNKCCGDKLYTPADNKLCCNGILHHLTDAVECLGGVLYVQNNTDCLSPSRPRLGEHCCGGKTFKPEEHICCDGHRYEKKTSGHFCCGSKAYDPHNKTMKCCSGHLHPLKVNEKAECCGRFLLKHDQNYTCCSSSTHSIIYSNKSDHHCCGHQYYNKTLWSCCSEQLKPWKDRSQSNDRLKQLSDLIPEICTKQVFLGKVDSMTLDPEKRHILLQVVGQIKSRNITEGSWLPVSLDHCSTPVLNIGMMYVWMKSKDGYKPFSLPIDPTSDLHIFYNACNQHKVG